MRRRGPGPAIIVLSVLVALVATGCSYIRRVDVTPTGAEAPAGGGVIGLSRDGRYALVWSDSPLLPTDGGPGETRLYRRDNLSGALVRVDVRDDGSFFELGGGDATMSGDGRLVAFTTVERVDPAHDEPRVARLYVRAVDAGTTEPAGIDTDGSPLERSIQNPRLNDDGTALAFIEGSNPGPNRILVRHLDTGTTVAATGDDMHGGVLLSGDGRHVMTWITCIPNCPSTPVALDLGGITYPHGAPAGAADISDNGRYLTLPGGSRYDRLSGTTISMTNGPSALDVETLSGNGRFVTIATADPALLPDPGTSAAPAWRAYLWDTASGAVRQLDVSAAGAQANGTIQNLDISRNGRYASFTSTASNLVDDDHNDQADGFVTDGAVPAPTAAAPNHRRGAEHVTVKVEGGFLLNTARADFGPGVTVESSSIGTHGSVRFVVSIAPDASKGRRDVRIANPGALGDAQGVCRGCFAVL